MKDGFYWVLYWDHFVIAERRGKCWEFAGTDGIAFDEDEEGRAVRVVRGPLRPPRLARLWRWCRMPPSDVRVLCVLREASGELSPHAVGERADVRKPSKVLQHLNRQGEVSFRLMDGVHQVYRLTAKGFERVKNERWP